MWRRIVISGAHYASRFLRAWIHRHQGVDHLARKVFSSLLGTEPVTIPAGPMRGIKLVPSPHVSHAHLRGVYEQGTLQVIDRYVRSGDVCYDIGASIGYLSLLMARRARLVYAFEPAPHAVAEMRRQVAVNGFGNIVIVTSPVTDSEREVSFALTDGAYGSGIQEEPTKWPVIRLQSTTLDLFIRDHSAPDFVKIDVEGEEGRVLEGARRLLETAHPIICCEVHSASAAAHVQRVLADYGYFLKRLDGKPFTPGQYIKPGDVQVLCLPS